MNERMIFLFSLPRSGSTLLQRILASHPGISTCAEPWLLLPLVYASRPSGVFTEFGQRIGSRAVREFIAQLPGGEETYHASLREFCLSLYGKSTEPGAVYFLDKTPRYYLIIPQIAAVFPEARFIFLFRNPLHVLSSIIRTWLHGRMRLESHYIDLYEGPRLLAEGYRQLKEKSVRINYEDIIEDPEGRLKEVFAYLELEFDPFLLDSFHDLNLAGRMGDPTGVNEYRRIDRSPLDKWKEVLNSRFRKKYALRYLARIGADTLETFGFSPGDLASEVRRIESSWNPGIGDRIDLAASAFYRLFEVPQLKRKLKARLAEKRKRDFLLHT